MKRLTCKRCESEGKREEGLLVAIRSFYATLATTIERQEEIVTDLTERANTAERELHRLREVHQALSALFEGSEEFRGKVAS